MSCKISSLDLDKSHAPRFPRPFPPYNALSTLIYDDTRHYKSTLVLTATTYTSVGLALTSFTGLDKKVSHHYQPSKLTLCPTFSSWP
ncbi:hypothetical protein RRG08_031846 [Elysia crispata]|uniref:Uncharacterized protein n=1 Tax=Elysia crispata TaxID=231223 RepID=A0AAE0Y6K9_9GAST|nr:hypothetical protein RRG08_031846 [Elysia crispata]